MKNLKKVLALVMAFAMAFTMFAGAVAFEDVELGSDYSAAISMLSDLEVVSGNGKGAYEPAKAVTRAEACVLLANMMNGGKADTARFAGGSNFSDVAHGWWGESAIAYCVQNGITYGVGGGKFAPNREITDAEFVAMLTRAMGYDTAANPLSFPYGNYTAAVNNGLLDNVPYVEGSDCTKGESAQMIYDALFADYARMSANLNVIHNSDDHDEDCTLIEDVFGLDRAANNEPSKCTQHYWVIVGESCEDDDIIFVKTVSDKKSEQGAKIEEMECTADVSALIGYKVVLWGENEHAGKSEKAWEVDTVKAVEVADDQTAYDYNPTMADSKPENNKLADFDDMKVEDEAALNVKNGNEYVLIDWDNDGDVDYINETVRYYGEIKSLNSKKVVVDVADGKTYTLDLTDGETTKYECEFDKCSDEEHDYVVELDAEEGDIVEIVVSDAYETTLTISITTVEPTAKTFDEMDKKGNVYFDGEKVEDAEENICGMVSDDLTKAELDNEYDVWTDANGYIIKIAPVDGSTEYFMVLGVEDGEDESINSRDEKAAMEVMYTDGTVAELAVAFDADPADMQYAYDDEDYYFYDEESIIGGIFEYELDDNGDVVALKKIWADTHSYSFSDKYDEITYFDLTKNKDNTVDFTGEEFVFVVDDNYVELTSRGEYTVDTDKVAILAVEDMDDIKKPTATAEYGAYRGGSLAMVGKDFENQAASVDVADGALFVVADLADYLGEKNHVVGAITNVSVKKDVYTFEINDGEQKVSTGKIDATTEIADRIDAAIIDVFATYDKVDVMELYGNALYADITLRDDKVIDVELLVDGNMKPVDSDSDYRVVRALVEKVGSDYVRTFTGARAASDKSIQIIDEVLDENLVAYELTEDTVVYAVNDEPALNAPAMINSYIAYDDTEMSAGADLADFVSDFEIEENTETLYVVDIIYDATEKDLPVYAAYCFEPVEDAEYVPTVKTEYTINAVLGRSYGTAKGDLVVNVVKTVKEDGVVNEELSGVVKTWTGKDATDVKVEALRENTDVADVNDPTKDMPYDFGGVDSVKPAGDNAVTGNYVVSGVKDFAAGDKVKVTISGFGTSEWITLTNVD